MPIYHFTVISRAFASKHVEGRFEKVQFFDLSRKEYVLGT